MKDNKLRRGIYLPEGFPSIVCLCGSTRFKQEFITANFGETMAGKVVLSVGFYGHADAEVYQPTHAEKIALDELHLRKIELADEVLVLNPTVIVCGRCGKPTKLFTELSQETDCCRSPQWQLRCYVGESTAREIAYALSLGKTIRYLVEENGNG